MSRATDHSILPRRRAFTLIELLVVVGIIALLIGLLIPAIQKVREAGQRTVCRNNLRQISLGLHAYHEVQHAFPPGMTYQDGRDPQPFLSWHARLLPFVEQDALWRATEAAYTQDPDFLHNPPHSARAVPMAIYACPSDPRVGRVSPLGAALTSYLGIEGLSQDNRNGILHLDSRVTMADVTDGLSNTLLVGERPPSADLVLGWWYAGWGQVQNGSAEMMLGVQEFRTYLPYITECVRGPYRFGPGSINDLCSVFHFWSPHPGGAMFAFGDGSVRFLPYTAEPMMPALASRNGGESAQLP